MPRVDQLRLGRKAEKGKRKDNVSLRQLKSVQPSMKYSPRLMIIDADAGGSQVILRSMKACDKSWRGFKVRMTDD